MLHEFLAANRDAILALTVEKTAAISESKPTSKELERGLPEFYDELIGVLKTQAAGGAKVAPNRYAPSTTYHGKESSRLGYSVSQVVHGYGVICQAITETAQRKGAAISPGEFSTLNLSLDTAIAEAVTGFASAPQHAAGAEANTRASSLVHELRNALACAITVHAMLKEGIVGTKGSTSDLLGRSLLRMQDLIDRSLSEIRLEIEAGANLRPMCLIEAVDEVEMTAAEEARSRGLTLSVRVDRGLQVNVDRGYLVSALSNLLQNAIKFSKPGGGIGIRSREEEKSIVLEVEDRCGGLPAGKAEELFQPFIQKSSDRTGLGLGLSISRRAVALNKGTLTVRDLPGVGCVFSITFPKIRRPKAGKDRSSRSDRGPVGG